jgi:predicted ATP-dependent serine protease
MVLLKHIVDVGSSNDGFNDFRLRILRTSRGRLGAREMHTVYPATVQRIIHVKQGLLEY